MLADGRWSDRVKSPGFVSNAIEWMTACDVMIAPAVEEPLARVGVEAQSVGLPVIVSSDGGLREVVEHGVSGLIVDPDKFDDWVAAVQQVLDSPALAARLQEGGRHSAAKLTIGRHADAIEATYSELTGGRVA
jgi:glycosyltransferase involved in cell wall biosynthesis